MSKYDLELWFNPEQALMIENTGKNKPSKGVSVIPKGPASDPSFVPCHVTGIADPVDPTDPRLIGTYEGLDDIPIKRLSAHVTYDDGSGLSPHLFDVNFDKARFDHFLEIEGPAFLERLLSHTLDTPASLRRLDARWLIPLCVSAQEEPAKLNLWLVDDEMWNSRLPLKAAWGAAGPVNFLAVGASRESVGVVLVGADDPTPYFLGMEQTGVEFGKLCRELFDIQVNAAEMPQWLCQLLGVTD